MTRTDSLSDCARLLRRVDHDRFLTALFAPGDRREVEFRDGFSLISDIADLKGRLVGADLAVTGEGRLDSQSLVGKVPVNIARLAQAAGVPAVAFAGRIDGDLKALRAAGLDTVVPIVDQPMTLDQAMERGSELIERAAARFMATLRLGRCL